MSADTKRYVPPVVHARPAPAPRKFGSAPSVNFIPETWMQLPDGPEKEIAVRRWIAQELQARGMQSTAMLFAEAWCGDWRPLSYAAAAAQRNGARPSAPPPALRLVGGDDEDPFAD